MGMRDYCSRAMAARITAAIIAGMMFISIVDVSYVNAGEMTAEERAKEIAEQEAKERATAEQREKDRNAYDDKVEKQIAKEALHPGKAKYLRATTSTTTKGIKSAKASNGYRYVHLKWKGTENANKYFVYYSYKRNGTYKKKGSAVKTTQKRNMLFRNNKEVFLKVLACNDENKGKLSASVVIWPGYGSYVNATKIKIKSGPAVMFAGYTGKYRSNSNASMLKTYKIKWTSSNKNVATVGKTSGKVVAKAKGTTTITAVSHAGFKVTKKLNVRVTTPSKVPNVKGLTRANARKVLNNAGFKVTVVRRFVKKVTMRKSYNNQAFGTIIIQNKKAGSTLQKGSTVRIVYAEKLYYFGKGVNAMVKWAKAVAKDNSYGYSMGVYPGRGLDRLCPYTNKGASKDYDCATFVNAALAFSGMGSDFMKATVMPSPVVGGVKSLLIKNGWKKVRIKRYYWRNGKKVYYYTKPMVSELKKGDIVLNTACHIQIHIGNGKDVGAHNDYDGRSGDSSGREISIGPSWTGYAEVYRYHGNIGK